MNMSVQNITTYPFVDIDCHPWPIEPGTQGTPCLFHPSMATQGSRVELLKKLLLFLISFDSSPRSKKELTTYIKLVIRIMMTEITIKLFNDALKHITD